MAIHVLQRALTFGFVVIVGFLTFLLDVSGGHHDGTIRFSSGTLTGPGLSFSNAHGGYTFDGTTTIAHGYYDVAITDGSNGVFYFGKAATISDASNSAMYVNGGAPKVYFDGAIQQNTLQTR